MPVIKKENPPLYLLEYDSYIEDTSENSTYFQVSNIPSIFAGGRNSFLVNGSDFLADNSILLMEIIDVEGNTIYNTFVENYTVGYAKMVSVEIYDTTPTGPATIVIMGKIKQTVDGQPIPEEWKDSYNVRWTKNILVDYNVKSTSPLVFLNTPGISVVERRFLNIQSSSYNTVETTFTASLSPKTQYSVQSGYIISSVSPTKFSSDYIGGKITGSIIINNRKKDIDLPITQVINSSTMLSDSLISSPVYDGIIKKLLLLSGSYKDNIFGQPYDITSSAVLQYPKLTTSSTNIPISYANIRISNLDTVSGEINKFRVYSRVATNTADYKLIADVNVNVEELLVSSSIRGNTPIGNIGLTPNYSDNWYAGKLQINQGSRNTLYKISGSFAYYSSSYNVDTYPISSSDNNLLSSIYVNVPIDLTTNKFQGILSESGYFIGTKPYYLLLPTSEYTLQFDALYNKQSGSVVLTDNVGSVDIYLVPTIGKTLSTRDPLGQKIGQINTVGYTRRFQNTQFNFRIDRGSPTEVGVRFVVKNGFWNFSNISVKPASDPRFSPDETTILVPNMEYHNQLLEYKVEFFDINNNSVDISAVSTPTFFTGSAIDMGILP